MTTLVCPVCSARWKIVPEGEGDRPAVCPVCETRAVPTDEMDVWQVGDRAMYVDEFLPGVIVAREGEQVQFRADNGETFWTGWDHMTADDCGPRSLILDTLAAQLGPPNA
jgi:hypothetical protein